LQQKTKILNVLTVIEDGGMETLVSNIYEGLYDPNEFEFYICSLVNTKRTFVLEKLEKYCKKIFVLDIKNKELSISDYFGLFWKLFVLARFIKKNSIDVVNSHDFFSGAYTRIAVLISKYLFLYSPKKNYLTLHNLFFWLKKRHHLVNRLLSGSTDLIICVSRSVFEYSLQNDRVKIPKYKIILNGIDERIFIPDESIKDAYLSEFKLSKKDFIIGNIGTLSIRKGHIYLLKSFKEIVSIHPNLKLLIFGSFRSHEKEVKNEVMDYMNENNLNESVKFFDTRSDIKKIYNIFNVYVMSSVSEGLSLAAIEAMLMKRICVFSDIGPFKELVTDNENGFLFASKDHVSLREKLLYVINNYEAVSYIGDKARESIIEKFSFRRMIDDYYKLYNIKVS